MLAAIINPLPLVFTAVTAFGVLVHDTQIDRATTVALAVPTVMASLAAVDTAIRSGESHVHVEKATVHAQYGALRSALPRLQARDDDRHMPSKLALSGGADTGLWPSV